MDAESWMSIEALEYIDEVGIRVDFVEPTGLKEALNNTDISCPNLSPAEEPVFSIQAPSTLQA